MKKSVFQVDFLVNRLQTFPVLLFDTIFVVDEAFREQAKKGIGEIAEDILNGRDNTV